MQRNIVRICAAAAILTTVAIPSAVADFRNLLNRIPGEANALVLIDVEKIMPAWHKLFTSCAIQETR